MLLSLLGVSEANIISDYALSDSSAEEVRNKVVNDPATREKIGPRRFYVAGGPEAMKTFFEGIEKNMAALPAI